MNAFVDGLIRDVSALSSVPSYLLVTFLFFFLDSTFFLILCFGFLLSFLVTAVTRVLYFKQRPVRQSFSTVLEKIDASSFPSLHTMRATILFLTTTLFVQNPFLQGSFLFVIPLVGAARMLLKKHDFVDVMGGFFFGVLITGFLFVLF